MLLKAEGLYVFGPYRLDARERQLLRDGETISLPPKAFDVLVALVARAGHLVTKEELLAEVWAGTFVEDANISYTISLVRRALGEEADPIETVPKVGYRFTIPVSLVNGVASAIPFAATSQSRPWRVSRTVIAVVVLLLLLGAGAWIALTSRIARNSVSEPITVPVTSFGGFANMPRLSPDGRYVVYQWDGRRTEADAVNWDIYVQPVESTEPSRLTTDPTSEFGAAWSPDGERIAFLYTVEPGRYTIREISKLGGTPKTISPPDVFAVGDGIDWSPDGESIVFTTSPDSSGQRGLALLSYHTGGVTPLTRPPAGSMTDRRPRFSPDGQTVAFFRTGVDARDSAGGGSYGDIYTVAIAGGRERPVTSSRFLMAGHDWTADGKEIVFSSLRSGLWTLWRIAADKSGSDQRPVVGIVTGASYPSIARKSNRLAYADQRVDRDIWSVPVALGKDGSTAGVGTPSPVQFSSRQDTAPQVSRDGKRLVFVSQRSGDQGIWVSDIDGGQPQEIAIFPGAGSPRWSPTGTRVAFDASTAGHADIFVVGAQGIPRAEPLTNEQAENVVPSWSRDEKWIYFASNRMGRYEIWKVPADGGKATQVTRNGGFAPFESRDGKFIYYVKQIDERGIWRVPVDGGEETFVVDGPTARFWGCWSLFPDGIYFARQEQNERAPAWVHYFDFAHKGTTTVGRLDSPAIPFGPCFAMTPDGKSILYVKNKPTTSDIMLVKNFR